MVAEAVEKFPALAAATDLEPEAARKVLRFAERFEPVAREAENLAQAIRDAILVKRASVGADAFQAYDAAKALARKKGNEAMIAFTERMAKALAHGPRKDESDGDPNE